MFLTALIVLLRIIYYTHKKQKNEKQKGFRDGLSYSTPHKSAETRGNAITQPQFHPITKKCRILGWDGTRIP